MESATRTPASPHNDTSAPPGPSLDIKPLALRTSSQTPKTSPLSPLYQPAGNYNSEDEAFIEGDEIKTWRSGEQFQHPLPQTDDNPWMTCNGIVEKFDKDMCDVWKDEIQNLLIFAGLFSAVVTAFTIESYHLLEENSVTAYSERINILWFVSLSLSLATVSIGIVCMQWLREFQRDASLPPKDSVALRQMRYEGLLKWRVPGILSVLPLLLQGGLVIFLAGLLDLLWHLNHKVAIAVTVVVAGPMLFLAVTTVLPALQIIITQDRQLRIAQCPYKSPQSWAFYRVAIYSARFALYIDQYVRGHHHQRIATKRGVLRCFSQVRDWLQYDMYWWQLREAFSVNAAGEPCLTTDSHDIIRGLVWIAEASVHSIPWISAVQACFRDLDSLPAVKALRLLFRTKGDLVVSSGLRVVRDPATHQDIVAAHVLSYFREQNHQLHEFLLPHRTELYVRIRNSSVGSYNMKDGVTCPVSTFRDVKQLPKDVHIQFLYCFSSLLAEKDVKQDDMDAAWYIFVIVLRDPQLPDLETRRALVKFLGSLERWVNETEGPARLRAVEGLVDHILAFHRSRAYAFIRERVPECLPLFASVLGSLDDAVVQYGFPESFSRMPDVDYWWGLAMEMRANDTPVPGDTQ